MFHPTVACNLFTLLDFCHTKAPPRSVGIAGTHLALVGNERLVHPVPGWPRGPDSRLATPGADHQGDFPMGAVKVIFDITNIKDLEAEKVSTYLETLNGVTTVDMIHPHGNGHKATHEFWVSYDPDRTHMRDIHTALEHNGYQNFAVSL
jgi:hypothetical protein